MKHRNQSIPTPAQMRTSLMVLAMSSTTRDILDRLDIEQEKSVATLGRLLHAGAVPGDKMVALIGRLQDAGAKPSRGVLEELAVAVRTDPLGRAALVFNTN